LRGVQPNKFINFPSLLKRSSSSRTRNQVTEAEDPDKHDAEADSKQIENSSRGRSLEEARSCRSSEKGDGFQQQNLKQGLKVSRALGNIFKKLSPTQTRELNVLLPQKSTLKQKKRALRYLELSRGHLDLGSHPQRSLFSQRILNKQNQHNLLTLKEGTNLTHFVVTSVEQAARRPKYPSRESEGDRLEEKLAPGSRGRRSLSASLN